MYIQCAAINITKQYVSFTKIYLYIFQFTLLFKVSLTFPFKHSFHDDVIKWEHFPLYWPFVRGIHRSSVNSPHEGEWRGALIFSLICAWINGSVMSKCIECQRSNELKPIILEVVGNTTSFFILCSIGTVVGSSPYGCKSTWIPAWISNHILSKVWDEITYPFPNFNACTVEVWEWISDFISHFIMDVITYRHWD